MMPSWRSLCHPSCCSVAPKGDARAVVEIADGCLIDDPVSVRAPGRRVRLRVHCTDAAGLPFASWAEYRVSDDGTLDAARQSPLAGIPQGGVGRRACW